MRHIQAASPWRVMRTVRFLGDLWVSDVAGEGAEDTYTTLEVSVPRLPTKERRAMVRSIEFGLFL